MFGNRFPYLRATWRVVPLLLLVGGASCASAQRESKVPPNWGPALAISDAAIEVRCFPEIGRVMHFSKAGGPNLLWINDIPTSDTPGSWVNYGGDKVWPWPQKAWGWPPPKALDAGPYVQQPSREDTRISRAFRIESPVDVATGLVATRETHVREGVVHNSYTLERRREPAAAAAATRVCTWAITQVPLGATFVRLRPAKATAAVTSMSDKPQTTRPAGAGWLEVLHPTGSGKIGVAADALAARIGDQVLLIERVADNDDAGLPRDVSVQIYMCNEPWGHYTELEFLGAGKELKVGEKATLQTQWRIMSSSEFQQVLGLETPGIRQ